MASRRPPGRVVHSGHITNTRFASVRVAPPRRGRSRRGCPPRRAASACRSRGKLKGEKPELTGRQQADPVRSRASGEFSIAGLMEVFTIGRATVNRILNHTTSSTSVISEPPA